MDTNRFRKRTDYALPPKRPAPVLDEMGQLRPAPASPSPAQQIRVTTPEPPRLVAPAPPRPVYEKPAPKADEGLINLSEPTHGGWLDAIAPELDEDPIIDVPEALASPASIAAARQPVLADDTDTMSETGAEAAAAVMNQPQTNISIQISMPNLPKLHWPTLPDLPYKRIAIWSAIAIGVLAASIGGYFAVKHYYFHPKPQMTLSGAQALAAGLTRPTFAPVAPKTKPELADGKSEGTAFDGHRDSYSYTDALQGVPFTVSEQPIPATFSSTSQAIATAAKSLGATMLVPTSGLSAYEDNNTKNGTQTLVFSVNNLLMFIQSNFPHSSQTWGEYIDSLQVP